MNSSKMFLSLLAVATLTVPAQSTFAADFKDVSGTYEQAVDFVSDGQIAQGISATEFGITRSITRGETAVMIANALNLEMENAPASPFADTNSRVKKAIDALYAAKIISGKTDTTYVPDAPITRAEMAKVLTNAFKLTPSDIPTSFEDLNTNWEPYVAALLEAEVTFGKTHTTFAPNDLVTRGEFALFLYRGMDYLPARPDPGGDNDAPELDYTGPTAITLSYGAEYTPPTVKAVDKEDGEVLVERQIFYGTNTTAIKEIDTFKSGNYTVRYSARDKAGNVIILKLDVTVSNPVSTVPPPVPTPDPK